MIRSTPRESSRHSDPSRFVYLDASNIWIAGAQVSAALQGKAHCPASAAEEGIFDSQLRVNFRALLHFIVGECPSDAIRALCVGSTKAHCHATPWLQAQLAGWTTYAPERSASGREKEVDTFLSVAMMVDLLPVDPRGKEITICSGDRDLLPAIEALRKKGHAIDVASWEHATSAEVKRVARKFIPLDGYFPYLTFRTSAN